MIIIGAGLSGLLAARRLWTHNPVVVERQQELPNNHSALLRFRSRNVGEVLGIPFRPVAVYKGILQDNYVTVTNHPTIKDMNSYSLKTTGQVLERSIMNTDTSIRYIAPGDLVSKMSQGVMVSYNMDAEEVIKGNTNNTPVISTIPMPELMRILEYPKQLSFVTKPIWTMNCDLEDVNVYQTLYVPYGGLDSPYRISVTGNRLTAEWSQDFNREQIIEQIIRLMFGYEGKINYTNPVFKKQSYGKIVTINEEERQRFILWATNEYNIYSLGRYATWRQILLDDVLEDINIIDKFIRQKTDYARVKHYQEK